ncbi:MAG: hypothetical protein QW057_10010 [Candidatus Bathyarchaeia archaeon]
MVLSWTVEKREDSDFGYVVIFSDGIVVPWPLPYIREDNLPILMHLYYVRRNWLTLTGVEAEETAELDQAGGFAADLKLVQSVMKQRSAWSDRLTRLFSIRPNVAERIKALQGCRVRGQKAGGL